MPPKGICCICAEEKDLTFEHLPPESAFNKGPVQKETWDQAHARHPLDEVVGDTAQRGFGDFTLCGRCNSNTGAWYVKEYGQWAIQAGILLARAGGDPRLTYLYHGFPLRFFKQVMTMMMMSVSGHQLTTNHPSLRRFLLSKKSREFDSSRLRLYAFYNPGTRIRQNAMAVITNIEKGGHSLFSEFSAFPFGFVLTDDSPPPDNRLQDITFLANFDYDDLRSIPLTLPSFPIVAHIPGIYQSADVVAKMRKPE